MKHVVIIGGGFAGAYCARKLENDFFVTLIDAKNYFEFTPGVLRTLIEPEHFEKIHTCHTSYLRKATIIHGKATQVTTTRVLVGGRKIYYDYLIIATGTSYNEPFKQANLVDAARADCLKEKHDALRTAKDVLIIGGGIVGTELAGEIITLYPHKQIIIVHSHEKLIQRNPQKAINYATTILTKQGVKIIYTERVVSARGKIFVTNKKTKIVADLAFLCTGITPNSSFLASNLKHALDNKGHVKVNPHLQVVGMKYVFAPGDINTMHEEKTAQAAEKQAEIVVHNIYALEKKHSLATYMPTKKPMVISLGRWNGLFVWNNFVWCGLIPGILKRIIEWKVMLRYR